MKTRILILAFILTIVGVSCKPKSQAPVDQPAVSVQAAGSQKMIAAKVYIKPGLEEDFITAAKWIVENTLKEEGCLEYTLYQDPNNKSSFLFFERYKNQAAIDAHFAASYFKEFGSKIGEMTARATEIKIYDISVNE